jgi:hypothetical protein
MWVGNMTNTAEQQDLLYQRLTQSIHINPGSTAPSLRKALTEYAQQADLAGAPRFTPESGLPSDLQTYVTKVCKYAYKVTDDIRPVLAAGVNKQAIEDALRICACFNIISRIADAFDVEIPNVEGFTQTGIRLFAYGYV